MKITTVKGTRWDYIPRLFRESGFTVGAEIGVELGKFSSSLLRKIPGLTLYSIDPWVSYANQNSPKRFYDYACKRLGQFEGSRIIKKFSTEAMELFKDDSLDFVFIDANHDYVHTLEDIIGWYPKVRTGGIVAGHDFIDEPPRYGVKSAVTKFITDRGIEELFVLEEPRRGNPCWYFKK